MIGRRARARLGMIFGAAVLALSGCAATRGWWDKETGRMDAAEAASHGYPDCAGLTLAACGKKHPPPAPNSPK